MHVSGRQSDPGWTLVHARERTLHEFRLQYLDQRKAPDKSKPPVADDPLSQVNKLRTEMDELRAKVENLSQRGPGNGPDEDGTRILRERIMKLKDYEFERLVGEFLKAKGFSNVNVTQRSGDGGIDGDCELPFINVRVAFQAKQYEKENVGISPVQRLNGSLGSTYDRGVFITTSSFTMPAKGWIEEEEAPITLVDGQDMVTEMMEMELGVNRAPMVRYEIDERFFDKLKDRS